MITRITKQSSNSFSVYRMDEEVFKSLTLSSTHGVRSCNSLFAQRRTNFAAEIQRWSADEGVGLHVGSLYKYSLCIFYFEGEALIAVARIATTPLNSETIIDIAGDFQIGSLGTFFGDGNGVKIVFDDVNRCVIACKTNSESPMVLLREITPPAQISVRTNL